MYFNKENIFSWKVNIVSKNTYARKRTIGYSSNNPAALV